MLTKPLHTRFTQTCIFISVFLIFYAQGKLETGSVCLIENFNGYEVDPCPRLHYCEQGHCVHKGLANPQTLEIVCYSLVFILSGVACASGVGASYTLAPIIVMLAAYSSNAAIRIVYCLIFGGMIAAFTIKSRKRDPDTKTPLIQYELCLICLPVMVLGATYGVLLNITLPPLMIAICLITTMIVSLIRIQKKIKLLREQEKKKEIQMQNGILNEINVITDQKDEARFSEDKDSHIKETIENKSSIIIGEKISNNQYVQFSDEIELVDKNSTPSEESDSTSNRTKGSKLSVDISQEAQSSEELSSIYQAERRLFPVERFVEFALLLGAMVLLALMRGTSSLESILGVEYCSGEYWMLLAAAIPCMLLFHWRGCYVALKADERKVKANYPFKNNQFRLDKKMLNPLRILCFTAGFLSGTAGVGVGVILIPYLLGKGMKSPSASATSGFFNVFTAFTSMLLAVLGKDLRVEEMIFYCLIGFFGAGLCCKIVAKLSEKLKINYLEVLMVWSIVLVGLVVSPGLLVYIGVDNPSGLLKFKNLC